MTQSAFVQNKYISRKYTSNNSAASKPNSIMIDNKKLDFSNTIYRGTEPSENPFSNRKSAKKRKISNLFYSIINYASATLFEPDSIKHIFKNYNEILKEKYHTSEEFQKSMKNSLLCFENNSLYKDKIATLKDNNPESFVILPVFSNIHTFTEVIRKQNGVLKFYSIDKFTSNFGGLLPTSSYAREIVVKPENVNKLVDTINKNAFNVDTSVMLDTLKKYSSHIYDLKIPHTEQKLITCLYKEPEAGIKFAFATRNLNNEDFQNLRTRNKFSNNFKVKWDNNIDSTIDIHNRFLKKLKSSNSDIDLRNLDKVFQNYVENKIFRREIKKNPDLFNALSIAFDPNNKITGIQKKEKMSELIKRLNLDSIHQVPQLRQLYFDIVKPYEAMDFEKNRINTDISGAYCYVFSNYDLDKVLKSVSNIEKKLPIVAQQAFDYHTVVNTVVAYDLFKMYMNSEKKSFSTSKESDFKSLSETKESDFKWVVYKIDKAIRSGPYSDKAHFAKGVIKLSRGLALRDKKLTEKSSKEINDAIVSLENTVALNPDFTEAKLFLLVAYKNSDIKMNKAFGRNLYDLENDVFRNKIEIGPRFSFSINNKNLFFDCMTKEVAKEIYDIQKSRKEKSLINFESGR